jgi:ubiquitin-conjugating enzyme E2 J2
VRRKGALNFHFCLFGLDGDYSGGYYHGILELPEDYPFSPPKLKFFTPSGRFEVDTPICTTFTNFHKETWSTAWNVETMVLATISFMQSEVTNQRVM